MDKAQLLKNVENECKKANLPLKEIATNLVFGKGNPNAEIMFVGEAAGHNEDLQGLPFVGVAGKNLDRLLDKVGLNMDNIYIANILKYRPPENRDPTPEEIRAHTPWLMKQISVIKPKIICSLGNYATKFLLAEGNIDQMDKQEGITKIHGRVRIVKIDGMKVNLIPLFHPAAIIYNPKLKELWEMDMHIVKKEVSKLE